MKNMTPGFSQFAGKNTQKFLLLVLFISISIFTAAQQKIIQLYTGQAPGSENWNWKEGEVLAGPPMSAMIAYNVTKPSLVVFEPDSANGVAVILSPGGSYHVLNIEREGINVANYLTKKGITVFLFKYRLIQSHTNDLWQEMMETRKDPEVLSKKMVPLRIMAMEDLNKAVAYVRNHAADFKIDANKIGIVGFSAGGVMAANIAYNFSPYARPDFVAPIYCVIYDIDNHIVKTDAPPLFIAAATDDPLAPVSNSIDLYTDWVKANKPAELHLYAKGGHGLRSLPASSWKDRFVEWLHTLDFLK